jgi:hypothetical protein
MPTTRSSGQKDEEKDKDEEKVEETEEQKAANKAAIESATKAAVVRRQQRLAAEAEVAADEELLKAYDAEQKKLEAEEKKEAKDD